MAAALASVGSASSLIPAVLSQQLRNQKSREDASGQLPARRAWSALRGSLRRAPAGGRRQGARRASEPEGTVPSSGEEGRDQRSSAARSSRPREGSREGGGGSAHAARSFRRSNRGRPRERQAK